MNDLRARLDRIERAIDTLTRTRSVSPKEFADRQAAKQTLIAEVRALIPEIRAFVGGPSVEQAPQDYADDQAGK